MSTGFVVERTGQALIIRFDRPEIRNPLSVHLLESLDAILDEHDSLADLKAIIFTGTADAFASGADLREIAAVGPESARQFSLRGQRLMDRIADLDQLTIAAVKGYCFGGGLDLALACDRRIASPKAVFSHPGSGLGIITGWGGTQRLPRLIGQANALEMFFTGDRITADAAQRIGLVDGVFEDACQAAMDMASSA
jgi:enoyl-CoA hydratase